jgi:hypothetical protein
MRYITGMAKRDAAMVIEKRATRRIALSKEVKYFGVFIEICNKNPKRIPAKVASNALSFSMVS